MKPMIDEKHSADLAPFASHGAYGYKNKITDEIVIPCIYDSAGEFCEGLARVRKNKLYGFIDITGNLVIPCRYEDALRFDGGMAAVMEDKLWGFINQAGEMIVKAEYDYIRSFSEGLAPVKRTRNGDISTVTAKWLWGLNTILPTAFVKA